MSDLLRMDVFSNTNSTESTQRMPKLLGLESQQEMLDYMVLVLSRYMACSVAFKGGYLLNQLLGNHSRHTTDVDLSIAKKGDYELIKKCLSMIAEKFKSAGLITAYTIKTDIAEGCSGGIDMYDDLGRKVLGVDVGLHNIGYGVRHYDLSFTEIDGFTVERMLADKLVAISTRKRFRRTKDLYDFWAITNFFDINGATLADCIERRGGAEWDNIPFDPAIVEQYLHAWQKLDLRAFDGTDQIEKPNFDDALNRYYEFALALKAGNVNFRWESMYGRKIQL